MRRATPQHAAAIAAVEAVAADHPWTEAQVADTLAAQTSEAWVIGEPAFAHLLTSAAGPTVDILTIAVHPDHRRTGVARRLLTQALAHWAARSVDEVFLEVRADNAPARGLYAALGFQSVGLRKGYYSDGCDALVLRRALTAD